MIDKILKKFFNRNEKELKKLWPIVYKINERFDELVKENISDDRLKELSGELRDKLFDKNVEEVAVEENIIEAFALVKYAAYLLKKEKYSYRVMNFNYTWDMVPYDVQLLGGIVLAQGKIAEMATGEGKTLVATMPLYLYALTGRGVHLVTVNDYLAQRDREWMKPIFDKLGITTGVIKTGMPPEERKRQYACDITYGTNSEFGFDYLRDNMTVVGRNRVQRGFYYAIIDEVDSILIDEARTPLIISGPVQQADNKHYDELVGVVSYVFSKQQREVRNIIKKAEDLYKSGNIQDAAYYLLIAKRGLPKDKRLLRLMQEPGMLKKMEEIENAYIRDKKVHELDKDLYFSIEEKSNAVDITDKGIEEFNKKKPGIFDVPNISEIIKKIEDDDSLSDREKHEKIDDAYREYAHRNELVHALQQLLKAYTLFEKNVDYIIQDGKVIIVDEFTGRLMPGRRFSEGLHQAIEAKEGVTVQGETQTFATITLQNFFRMYDRIAGMTGTAETEATEFWEIYKLDVIVIPTNEPIRRIDYDDVIYKTKNEKYKAIVDEIIRLHKKNVPVLVGTTSVDVSERLGRYLKLKGIKNFQILNAKYHQKEAEIVAKAGEPGAITIATNMAGRGTDIKLGEGVVKCKICCLKCDDERYKKRGETLCDKCGEEIKKEMGFKTSEEVINYCKEHMPCGLHIIGTERHESRRIDRQLRGRAGRQGDPGSSKFFLSLEDDLMRIFGSDRMSALMDKLNAGENEPITHPLVTKTINMAQQRVERYNFDIRKHLLEYDDVMNKQREVIYHLRQEILDLDEAMTTVWEMIKDKNFAPDFSQYRILQEIYGVEEGTSELDEIKKHIRDFIIEKIKNSSDPEEEYFTTLESAQRRQFNDLLVPLLMYPYNILEDDIIERCGNIVPSVLEEFMQSKYPEEWDIDGIKRTCIGFFRYFPEDDELYDKDLLFENINKHIAEEIRKRRNDIKEAIKTGDRNVYVEFIFSKFHSMKNVMIYAIDINWMDHLYELDALKEGIGFRGYAQKNPIVEYKKEAFMLFEELLDKIDHAVAYNFIMNLNVEAKQREGVETRGKMRKAMDEAAKSAGSDGKSVGFTVKRETPKVGRNDPCPCGSGKKYKHCCGRNKK